jgi:hypothetical protein
MAKLFNATLLFFVLFLCSMCKSKVEVSNMKDDFNKNTISMHFFIPSEIKWDTLNFEEKIDMKVISKKFTILHFVDDTTMYMFNSLNEIENDSILLLVENIQALEGHYKIAGNICFIERKRLLYYSVSKSDYLTDSIKIESTIPTIINYKNNKYRICNNLFKESINRVSEIERR